MAFRQGIISAKTSGYLKSTSAAPSEHKSSESSLEMRSGESLLRSFLQLLIALEVSSSIENERTAENRSARRMRSASSLKRVSAFPTQRISLFSISSFPPNGSKRAPFSSSAMAFIVKSRRERSSEIFFEKLTKSGWRLSEYALSVRKVVISTGVFSMRTVTVPWARPVGITACFSKTLAVSCGSAFVAMSMSCTGRPISLSLTEPPTRKAE